MPLTHYSKFSIFTLRIWVFKSGVLLFFYSFSVSMVRRRISEAQRWLITGMLPNRHLSTRTVRNRLKSAGFNSRRVIKRPLLADQRRRSRLAWCLARRSWNLRTWRKIHWSDENRFLLHATGGGWGFGDTNIQPIPQGTSSQLSLTVEAQ